MARGKYQLIATCGGMEVFRRGFDHRDEADKALAEALVRYRHCEVRLTESDTALLSAGPARSRTMAYKQSTLVSPPDSNPRPTD